MYTLTNSYVCMYYLACEFKKLSELPVGSGVGCKHGNIFLEKISGIGIPDLLMNLMSCHEIMKNKNSVVILKCPKSMLE